MPILDLKVEVTVFKVLHLVKDSLPYRIRFCRASKEIHQENAIVIAGTPRERIQETTGRTVAITDLIQFKLEPFFSGKYSLLAIF